MTLRHEVRGSGPPVLLVHAGVADMRMWSGVAQRLASAHRVVTCDLRGFGRTPLTPGRFSNAGDLAALLDELGIERAVVVGASYGGRVALELALRHPERVRALALLAAAIEPFDWSADVRAFGEAEAAALDDGDVDAAVALNVAMWVEGPRRSAGDVDAGVRELVATMQREAFEAQLGVDADEEGVDPPAGERLREIRVPALVAVGEQDVADFRRIAERLATELPGAGPLRTIGVTAHLPALERPQEVADLLLGFLRGLR